jgi:hypothetical protein
MVNRISDCCNNLNPPTSQDLVTELIGDDVTSTITVDSLGGVVAAANDNRRLIKIFVVSTSDKNTEIWVRYGAAITLLNAAHPIPERHLLIIDSTQSRGIVSAITSSGTAIVRVSLANKI